MGAFPTGVQLGENGGKDRRLGGYKALQVERIGTGHFQFPRDAARLLVAAGLVIAASSIHFGAWSLEFSQPRRPLSISARTRRLGQRRAQQQMVDAQAGIPGESISEMAPASASAPRW